MLSTVKIVAIFTSARSTIFLNERFTKEADDDLEIVTGAPIRTKDKFIEVADKRGKATFDIINSSKLFLQEYKKLASA